MSEDLLAFIDLETGFENLILPGWEIEARKASVKAARALELGQEQQAIDALNDLSMDGVLRRAKGKAKALAVSALLYGASNVTGKVSGSVFEDDLPFGVDNTLKAFFAMTGPVLEGHVKKAGLDEIDTLLQELKGDQVGQDVGQVELRKAEESWADRLNKAVNRGGRMMSGIGANLTTSRLVTFGFLAQARASEVTYYRLQAILDKRTSHVCEGLNGREFRVEHAYDFMKQVLMVTDPEDLKSMHPWLKADKATAADLKTMPSEELMSKFGIMVPPFHPRCRTILIKGSTRAYVTDSPSPFAPPPPAPTYTQADKDAAYKALKFEAGMIDPYAPELPNLKTTKWVAEQLQKRKDGGQALDGGQQALIDAYDNYAKIHGYKGIPKSDNPQPILNPIPGPTPQKPSPIQEAQVSPPAWDALEALAELPAYKWAKGFDLKPDPTFLDDTAQMILSQSGSSDESKAWAQKYLANKAPEISHYVLHKPSDSYNIGEQLSPEEYANELAFDPTLKDKARPVMKPSGLPDPVLSTKPLPQDAKKAMEKALTDLFPDTPVSDWDMAALEDTASWYSSQSYGKLGDDAAKKALWLKAYNDYAEVVGIPTHKLPEGTPDLKTLAAKPAQAAPAVPVTEAALVAQFKTLEGWTPKNGIKEEMTILYEFAKVKSSPSPELVKFVADYDALYKAPVAAPAPATEYAAPKDTSGKSTSAVKLADEAYKLALSGKDASHILSDGSVFTPNSSRAIMYVKAQWSTVTANYAETTALKSYTGSWFQTINAHLRSGKSMTPEASNVLNGLRSVFSHNGLAKKVLAYRGIQDINAVLGLTDTSEASLANLVGKTIVDKGFNSVSMNRDTAQSFSGGVAILNLKVPVGAKAIPVAEISQYEREAEILLNENTKIRIDGVKKLPDGRLEVYGEVLL